MKRINYIIGICILAASLITAATQGYMPLDEGIGETETEEKEEQPPHKKPIDYWPRGDGSLSAEVIEPENFKPGEILRDTIVQMQDQAQYSIDLKDIIPSKNYTYYCIYRSSCNRDSSLSGVVGGNTYSMEGNNNAIRPYHRHKFYLWYKTDTDLDLRKLVYKMTRDAGPDTLIMEVSTLTDYYCEKATGEKPTDLNQGGGSFRKPSSVDRYRVIIEDNRALKSPGEYWPNTADVSVVLPKNTTDMPEQTLTFSGYFSETIGKENPQLKDFNFICFVADADIAITGLNPSDRLENTKPRQYKQTADGRQVAVWYRNWYPEDGSQKKEISWTVSPTDMMKGEFKCELYYGKNFFSDEEMEKFAEGSSLDLSSLKDVNKISYTFKEKLPATIQYIKDENVRHEKIDTLYALPGERIKILQQSRTRGGIDGYIAWHSPDAPDAPIDPNESYKWYKERISFDVSSVNNRFEYYTNGIAYFRKKAELTDLSQGLCYVYYHVDPNLKEGETRTLIWDASSMLGAQVSEDLLTPPDQVTIRHKYVFKHAGERVRQLKNAKTEYDNAINKIGELNTDGFFERYEIHTPYYGKDNGTSFRLTETLSNYYISEEFTDSLTLHSASANSVRWRVYDESGQPARFDWFGVGKESTMNISEKIITTTKWDDNASGGTIEWPNIFYCRNLGYVQNYDNTQKKFYVTAEVGKSETGPWYPVSLLTVYLEPNADFKTEKELMDTEDAVYHYRLQENIEKDYVLLDSISFDAAPGIEADYSVITDPKENYRNSTLEKDRSEYAVSATFAYDDKKRASGLRGIFRGEYGLFKTLNVANISTTGQAYQDWFCSTTGGKYYVSVYDRHYEYRKNRDLPDEMGFFMYVDATDVPGVITKLPLNERLCVGTRLLVTAWVCNLQAKSDLSIAADLGFTFKGVTKEGDETILNKFYTGAAAQVPFEGAKESSNPIPAEWQQICFYFDIKPGEANYASYLLEVANNCRHSNGADFAVDDIRIYKMNPELYVEREEACNENDLVVRTGYEHILGVYGKTAESRDETMVDPNLDSWMKQLLHLGLRDHEFNVYYSFTDEYKFNARADSVHWLFLDYNNNGDRASHGRVIVSTKKDYYNAWNNIKDPELLDTYLNEESRRRKLRAILDYKGLFDRYSKTDKPDTVLTPAELAEKAEALNIIDDLYNSNPIDTAAIIKHEKFIELSKYFFTSLGITPIQLSWQTVADKSRGVISLAHVTKTIDAPGQTQADGEGTKSEIDHENDKLEEGTQYHVGLFKDEDFYLNDGLVRMDECFPVADFKVSYNGLSIFVDTETEVEDAFICSFSSVDLSAKLKFNYQGKEDSLTGKDVPIDWYVGTMKDKTYTNLTGTSVSLEEALDAFHEQCGESKDFRGTVDDLKDMTDFEYRNYLLNLCNDSLLYLDKNNFYFSVTDTRRDIVAIPNRRAIEYGSTYSYVICTEPKAFTIKVNENVPEAWLGLDEIDYEEGFQPAIRLGLKDIENSREEKLTIPIRKVVFSPEDEGTTKKVDHLGFAREVDKNFCDIIFTGESTDPDWKNAGQVAVLESIVAYKDEQKGELLTLRFIDFTNDENSPLSGLTFREGFEYELQVRFHEYDADGNYLNEFCDGFINFDIKVVPEYVTWKGSSDSRNWNNDDNWTRSSELDIYKGNKSADKDASDPTRTDLENSFAPMKFTKVTIPGEGANPILLDCKWDDRVISGLEDDLNPATDDIEFDLMVDRESRIADRFYANTCDEIYFKPNATLMSQQYLTYDTARVEFEMKEDQWYLLSSPLKGVVAGDMYSPKTDGGRQKTDAFAPIVFDYENGKNDRFEPAYYQRKWDNTAVLYFRNPDNTPDPDYHDSYLEAEWSTEYNDARVKYSTGTGFSVHVENLPGGNDTSLVRLPKADQEYSYYSNPQVGDVVNPDGAPQKIDREGNNGRLNPVDTAVVIGNRKKGSTLFLAGNPFMTYLDMSEFFKKNTHLESVYRVRDEKDQEVVVQVQETGTVTTNSPDGHSGIIAPLEGFFVEVKSTASSTKAGTSAEEQNEQVEITFGSNMQRPDKESENLRTRSAALCDEPTLFITAHQNGKQSSVALVKRQQASVGFVDNEDAVALLNVSDPKTPSLYSIAGTQATCINVIPEMANIPLGVYSEDESDVTLRFAGLEHFGDSLYLYDALKNEEILVDSRNAEVTVPGTTHGRYFLNVSRSIQVESQIRVYTPMPGQVVVASTAGDLLKSVRVYDLSGKVVSIFDHLSTTVHQFSLPTGFYIVCAESESCTEKSKISVR